MKPIFLHANDQQNGGSEYGRGEDVLPGHFIGMLLLGCLPTQQDISLNEDHHKAQGDNENDGKDRQTLSWSSTGLPSIAIDFSSPAPGWFHCGYYFQGGLHGCRCFSIGLEWLCGVFNQKLHSVAVLLRAYPALGSTEIEA